MSCDEAYNGVHAVKLIVDKFRNKDRYAIILMDCEMPIQNGWETTLKLRQLHQSGEIDYFPVIIGCTAYASDLDFERCISVGMSGYLKKPFTIDKLMETFTKFL